MFALSWAGDKGCACQIERWVSSQGFRASPAPGGEAAKDTKIPNNYFLILDFWILKAFSVFLARVVVAGAGGSELVLRSLG